MRIRIENYEGNEHALSVFLDSAGDTDVFTLAPGQAKDVPVGDFGVRFYKKGGDPPMAPKKKAPAKKAKKKATKKKPPTMPPAAPGSY